MCPKQNWLGPCLITLFHCGSHINRMGLRIPRRGSLISPWTLPTFVRTWSATRDTMQCQAACIMSDNALCDRHPVEPHRRSPLEKKTYMKQPWQPWIRLKTSPSQRLSPVPRRYTLETRRQYIPATLHRYTPVPHRYTPVRRQYTALMNADRFQKRPRTPSTLACRADRHINSVHVPLQSGDKRLKTPHPERHPPWRRRLPCSKTLDCHHNCRRSVLLFQRGQWFVVLYKHRKIAMTRNPSLDGEHILQQIHPKTSKQ